MQVRDVMTRDIQLANPDMSLKDAAVRMRDFDTGFLPVGEDDRLVGTITDRDITVRGIAEGFDPNSHTVRETMSPHIVYCFEDQDVKEVLKVMEDKQVRRMPILSREKRLVGVISIADAAARAHEDEEVGEALEHIAERTGKPRNV